MVSKDFPQPPALSLQQEALVFGMLHGRNSLTDYTLAPNGSRIHNFRLESRGFDHLAMMFSTDSKLYSAYARQNLFAINSDPRLSPREKQGRIRRYVNAYLDLIPVLDRKAFPPSLTQIRRGIPDYIPDGLTDMGSDPRLEANVRGREKIRVDKRSIFRQARPLFYEIFSSNLDEGNSDKAKMYTTQRVADFVYQNMPYDHSSEAFRNPNHSVPLGAYFEKRLAQCRHHALYTQVLLQAFGLTSKLMKTDISFKGEPLAPHVNNLVRINYRWYLLDTTNPEHTHGQPKVFIKPLPERDINLNTNTYTWRIQDGNGIRTYLSRNNMYWKIEDNVRNPV